MPQETETFTPAENFEGIGCVSIENLDIPNGGNAFLQLPDGATRLRCLQGPVISYVSQEWSDDGKPVGDKKRYAYGDLNAKKDANARIVITFLVFSRTDKAVKLWEISQKPLQKALKDVNAMQPNLSEFDIQINKTKKGNTNFYDYTIVTGQAKPFGADDLEKEAIKEVMENGLKARLANMNKQEEFEDAAEQAEIEAQIEARQKAVNATPETLAKEAEEMF